MADFNSAGQTALGAPVVKIAWMALLDILGDVMRVTNGPYPLTFSGTGDVDLDGQTYGTTAGLISVSNVVHKKGGAESVTATLSGLQGIDTTALNQIGTKSNWQGRIARLWMVIINPATDAVISVAPYYTGYMVTPRIAGSVQYQTITLEIEGFIASLSDASGRSYLSQAEFDPGDLSAAASIAAANGSTALGANAGASLVGGGAPSLSQALIFTHLNSN